MKIYHDDKGFWEKLKDIIRRKVHCEHQFNGPYSEYTYTMPDGSKYLYTEDDDWGIPYSLEKLS